MNIRGLSWNSVSDPASREATEQLRIKDSRAETASALRDHILRSSMASLADSIAAGVGSVIVFNPLNWKRDGVVSMDLDKGLEIVDRATDQPVAISVLHEGETSVESNSWRKKFQRLDTRSTICGATEKPVPAAETTNTTTLESSYYRVELDPSTGAVRSILR